MSKFHFIDFISPDINGFIYIEFFIRLTLVVVVSSFIAFYSHKYIETPFVRLAKNVIQKIDNLITNSEINTQYLNAK